MAPLLVNLINVNNFSIFIKWVWCCKLLIRDMKPRPSTIVTFGTKAEILWVSAYLSFYLLHIYLSICCIYIFLSAACLSFYLLNIYLSIWFISIFLSDTYLSFYLLHTYIYLLHIYLHIYLLHIYLHIYLFICCISIFLSAAYLSFYLMHIYLSICCIWLDVWESEFFVTWGVILKSVLFDFFFSFLDKYVSKALGFFIFFTKSFFFPGFSAIFVY